MKYGTWITFLLLFISFTSIPASEVATSAVPVPIRSVVVVGGGDFPEGTWKIFLEKAKKAALAKGKTGKITILIVAWASSIPNKRILDFKKWILDFLKDEIEVEFLESPIPPEEGLVEKEVEKFPKADAVVISGGDQIRLWRATKNPIVLNAFLDTYNNGTPYVVTSAGAAFASHFMILGDQRGYGNGSGFIENSVIEQHADVQKRRPRLMEALKEAPPGYIGISVYEDGAISFERVGDVYRGTVLGHKPVEILRYLPDSKAQRNGDEFELTLVQPGGIVEWSPTAHSLVDCLRFTLTGR